MDFEFSTKVKELQARVSAFMQEHVVPNENRFFEEIIDRRPSYTDEHVTAAGLGRQYGDANVSVQTLPGPEGSESYQATVLFADDPTKRIEIVWDDATDHPSSVTIHGDLSQWRRTDGVTLGSDLAAVETANGGPFMLSGFDWDYGGQVSDWRGGALSREACHIGMGFDHTAEPYPAGEAQFASNTAGMRTAHAKVAQIILTYPDE